jgi:hypothetical protein
MNAYVNNDQLGGLTTWHDTDWYSQNSKISFADTKALMHAQKIYTHHPSSPKSNHAAENYKDINIFWWDNYQPFLYTHLQSVTHVADLVGF